MAYKKREQLEKENKMLEKEIQEIKKMLENSLTPKMNMRENTIEDDGEIIDIPLNKTVKVINLYFGGLNLKTSESGGKIFRFNQFGDVRPIIYQDLLQILSLQYRFFTQGYCMILDNDVVKANGLETYYKNILTKKEIENILSYNDKEISDMFSNTTKIIKETIVDILMRKIINKEYVDHNKVRIISEIYGTDIYELAKNIKV